MTREAQAGLALFYGKAGCSACHSGPLLTDQGYHALMLPHFGPGRTRPVGHGGARRRPDGRVGPAAKMPIASARPSLRNVALTAPYGHNGAYPTLEGIVRHHLDPEAGFADLAPGDGEAARRALAREVRFPAAR